jgi:hypothetical protein
MHFFIYTKLKDSGLQEVIAAALEGIADRVYANADLIFIEQGKALTLQQIIVCMQECLQPITLDKEDIIYVFYPHDAQEIMMYPLKREGRIRFKRWVSLL